MTSHGWRIRNHSVDNLRSPQLKSNSFQRHPYQTCSQINLSDNLLPRRNYSQTGECRPNFKDNRYHYQNKTRWNQNQTSNNKLRWQNPSPFDRRSFILRSKDFKTYLVRSLEEIFARVDTWYLEEAVDEDDMDWQPEVEVVIPQMDENTAYTYGQLITSGEEKGIEKISAEGWRDRTIIGDKDRQLLGEDDRKERSWNVPRSCVGVGDNRAAVFLSSVTPYGLDEEEIG